MNIYAGVFEWYSWRVNHLLATGCGYSWAMAMVQAEKSWRNCSATTDSRSAIRQNSREDMFPFPGECQGPFPFAKRPFVLLSRAVVRWLVRSPSFTRDVHRATQLAKASAAGLPSASRRGKRIDDDVQLGY